MIYLTAEQILFLHARLIAETGGSHGLREPDRLLSAVGRPQATFEGRELYPDVYHKAAALLDSLIRNHPFIDGNKRTAIAAAAIFLHQNGLQLKADQLELENFTLGAAQAQFTLAEMVTWLRVHTRSEQRRPPLKKRP